MQRALHTADGVQSRGGQKAAVDTTAGQAALEPCSGKACKEAHLGQHVLSLQEVSPCPRLCGNDKLMLTNKIKQVVPLGLQCPSQ